MSKEEQIKEINNAISDGIAQWSNIMLESEANNWAFLLNYTPIDLMNASYIFQHVASNIGIKSGRINELNVVEFGNRFRKLIIDMTGYDPYDINPIHTDLINPSTTIKA